MSSWMQHDDGCMVSQSFSHSS